MPVSPFFLLSIVEFLTFSFLIFKKIFFLPFVSLSISYWCGTFLNIYQYLSFYLDLYFILESCLLVLSSPISIIILMMVFLGSSLNCVCVWRGAACLSVCLFVFVLLQLFFMILPTVWMMLVCLHDVSICNYLFLCPLTALPSSVFLLERAPLCQVPIRSSSFWVGSSSEMCKRTLFLLLSAKTKESTIHCSEAILFFLIELKFYKMYL